jgi:hypothetical protein
LHTLRPDHSLYDHPLLKDQRQGVYYSLYYDLNEKIILEAHEIRVNGVVKRF